jgi:hypothetical protein
MKAYEIIERHERFPEATEKLIHAFGFQHYRQAISDLMAYGREVRVENTDVVLIAISKSDYDFWKQAGQSDYKLNRRAEM